jgi:hypothetical protein
MELQPLYRCVAALDVHQAKLTVCVLREDAQGALQVELREFGGFKRDRRAVVFWICRFYALLCLKNHFLYTDSPYLYEPECIVMVFEPVCCPHCGSDDVAKHGKSQEGKQRYI